MISQCTLNAPVGGIAERPKSNASLTAKDVSTVLAGLETHSAVFDYQRVLRLTRYVEGRSTSRYVVLHTCSTKNCAAIDARGVLQMGGGSTLPEAGC